MRTASGLRGTVSAMILSMAAVTAPVATLAQGAPLGGGQPPAMREASQLDLNGETSKARAIFQKMIDTASTPAIKAAAQRAMAMSYAFDGDCRNTVKYEEMVIAYWATRESAEPQNAFYQEGEIGQRSGACVYRRG